MLPALVVPEILQPANPLRLRPLGHSLYSRGEVNELSKSDEVAKLDQVLHRYCGSSALFGNRWRDLSFGT